VTPVPAPPTAIVTGATGFVGRHLVERLAGQARLIGWCRPGGHAPDSSWPVEWRTVDILDLAAVRAAIEESRPAQLYHLAGAPHVGASFGDTVAPLRVNAFGTHHVLDAVRHAGRPCRVLVVSSAQIYGPSDEPIHEDSRLLPASPYGLSKLAADELARHSVALDALDIVIARPFNHTGPGQSADFAVPSFARQIALIEAGRGASQIEVGNVEARRDLTDVRDVVDAYVRLMAGGRTGLPYNVCSGRAWRVGDLLDELIHLAHVHVPVHVDAARLRPRDADVLQGDATRIRTELGWTPTIRVEQTLRDTLDFWRRTVAQAQ